VPADPEHAYASRGGLKLAHGLRALGVSPAGLRCADFGCSTGGFTDCLLQHGAARVQSIDTGYGVLAWRLRSDPRVVVRERTSALHAQPPEGGVDLVVMDMGWTPQRLCVPAALRWLGPEGRILTLVKPHYELGPEERHLLRRGVLAPEEARRVAARVLDQMPGLGAAVLGSVESPITGSRGARAGNLEVLALLRPARREPSSTA